MNATPSEAPSSLPAWARQLSEKYYSRTLSMFVLHGNVHDLVPWKRADKTEYVPLQKFLNDGLFGRRDLVVSYDRGGGLAFATPAVQEDFQRALSGYDAYHGTKYAQGLPRNPDGVLMLLDSYLRLRILDNKKIALSLAFAETLAPGGDASSMGSEDRNCLVILKRWAQNQAFLRADVTFVLITESLSGLNPGIVQNPGVSAIEIPLPDEQERLEFIHQQIAASPLPEGSDSRSSAPD
jgi:hypothetical protein